MVHRKPTLRETIQAALAGLRSGLVVLPGCLPYITSFDCPSAAAIVHKYMNNKLFTCYSRSPLLKGATDDGGQALAHGNRRDHRDGHPPRPGLLSCSGISAIRRFSFKM